MLNALLWNLLLTAGLAVVLAVLCRLASLGRRPALRYWLWLLLLAKVVTPPLVAVPLLPAVTGSDGTTAIATPPGMSAADRDSVWDQRALVNPAVNDTTAGWAGRDVGRGTWREFRSRASVLFPFGLLAVSLNACASSSMHSEG